MKAAIGVEDFESERESQRISEYSQSSIDLKRCSTPNWTIFFSFILLCTFLTAYSAKNVLLEQRLKIKVGYGIASTDLRLNRTVLLKLISYALLGGYVSGALGLGGGAIFNPLLLSLGVPPSVSSATGMYMILFSTAGSSAIYIIYKILNLQFAFWIGFWCSLGSLLGLYILNKVVKKLDRQSPTVFALTFILAISSLLVPIFGALSLKAQTERGIDIMEFHSIC